MRTQSKNSITFFNLLINSTNLFWLSNCITLIIWLFLIFFLLHHVVFFLFISRCYQYSRERKLTMQRVKKEYISYSPCLYYSSRSHLLGFWVLTKQHLTTKTTSNQFSIAGLAWCVSRGWDGAGHPMPRLPGVSWKTCSKHQTSPHTALKGWQDKRFVGK